MLYAYADAAACRLIRRQPMLAAADEPLISPRLLRAMHAAAATLLRCLRVMLILLLLDAGQLPRLMPRAERHAVFATIFSLFDAPLHCYAA